MKKNIIIAVSILVVGFVIGLLCRPKQYVETTIIERDTTYVTDTHTIEKPVPVTRVVRDTILVLVTDTLHLRDSIFITLPKETKTYKGEEYYAEVSGYKPNLDVIKVYPKTELITETRREIVRQKNFLSVGAEVQYIGNFYTYAYVEYERMLHKNLGIYGRFIYDVPTKQMGGSFGIKAQLGW